MKKFLIPMFDMAMGLSNTIDLVDWRLNDHQKRVAYIAVNMAVEMGLASDEQEDLLVAGLLHDIGALSLKERLELLRFEIEDPYRHAELGYFLLKDFPLFSKIAELIRFHHMRWAGGKGSLFKGNRIPVGGHILHLADRVAILIKSEEEILSQRTQIYEHIKDYAGTMFMPELVDVFRSLSTKEYFWLDIVSPYMVYFLRDKMRPVILSLEVENLLDLTTVFCKVIDFRSRFTATHSAGVAAVAEELSRLAGFSKIESYMMRIAGHLHDLGKLAVPVEILEKPSKLTREEFNIIKRHTFYTYRVLETISSFDVINEWASFHHERLDGKGYPFHHNGEELSLGSRIMSVSDIFTALSEKRPYRKEMTKESILRILQQMVQNSAIDGDIVRLLTRHYDDIRAVLTTAQTVGFERFKAFKEI